MDDTMDVEVLSPGGDLHESGRTSMETSPILSRNTPRNVWRTPRNVPASSSEETSSGFNTEDQDPVPPPIEDTDLIMIHRPVSPNNFQSDNTNETDVVAPSSPGENAMDYLAPGSSVSNPVDDASNSSGETAMDYSATRARVNEVDADLVEEVALDSEEGQAQQSEAEPLPVPDVENLPLAQRIRSPDLVAPERDPSIGSPERNSSERRSEHRNLSDRTSSDQSHVDRGTTEDSPVARNPVERRSLERSPLERNVPVRSPQERSPPERSPPSKKMKVELEVKNAADSDDEEEGKLCPICFDAWTNSGDHRLVSLRCGHLFGQQCIKHWLEIHKASDRKCPQCKKKATTKDIRALYASKIRVLDTSEQEALKETIKKLEEEKDLLSRELAHERKLLQEALKMQQEQQLKLQQLQHQGIFSQHQTLPATSKQVAAVAAQIKINQLQRLEVSRDGGCRVLAFNEWKRVLVASQSSVTPLFPDFGIRVIDTEEFRLRQLMPMHTKAIRDLSFNTHRKDLLLSASLDKTAKVFCMSSNASVMSINTDVPLWSCCWDGNNSNVFFAGSQNGITFQYDIRNTHTEVTRITTQGDGAGVVSLAPIPAGSWLLNGGFLSCRLNRLRVYERTSNSEFRASPLNIDGPFSALNYNHKTQHMLVSTKPTPSNPHVHHHLYGLSYAGAQPQISSIHSFLGGTTQRVLSRPCQIEIDGNVKDTLICAHQESEGHVAIWSSSSGQKIPAGPLHCSEHILDLCPFKVNNRTLLAALSEKSLRLYEFH